MNFCLFILISLSIVVLFGEQIKREINEVKDTIGSMKVSDCVLITISTIIFCGYFVIVVAIFQ